MEFDIDKDKWFPCFCEACLIGKIEKQMSPDALYCLACQQIIAEEYEITADRTGRESRYKYTAGPKSDPLPDKDLSPLEGKTTSENLASLIYPEYKEKTKMSILNSKPASILKFRPRGRPKTYKKRELPEGEIRELCAAGLGANAISTKLRKEKNIVVSRATIQRVLSGERK